MEKLGLMGIRMERMERSPHGVGPSGGSSPRRVPFGK
tara:strand:- start:1306 stop:1416 length:111 start_codon:yes stop_codon:yes gene_type:complete